MWEKGKTSEIPASGNAMDGYKGAVAKRNLRYYAIIAFCCLLPAIGFMAVIQQVSKDDDVALSKSIVQFAKAGDSGNGKVSEEKVGMLAGTGASMEETADMQTLGEVQALVGNQSPVEYDEIPLGENPVWNYSSGDTQVSGGGGQDAPPAAMGSNKQDGNSVMDEADDMDTEPEETGSENDTSDMISQDVELDSFYAWTSCSANVRTIPDRDSLDIIAVKDRGEKFVVIGENGEFWKVKWGTDSCAYIHKSCMTQTQP